MKKTNLVFQTAIASTLAFSFAAQANIATINRNFAVEQFLGSTPAATTLSLAPISYQFTAPVAAASTFYIYIALSGGATFTAAPAVSALQGNTSDGSVVDSTGSAGGTVQAVALAADSSYARFTVQLAAGKALSSISVFSFTPAAGTVANANVALATPGGTITANWVNNTAATTGALPAGDIDAGGIHTDIVATSAQGIFVTAASSAAFPFNTFGLAETAKINVGANPPNASLALNANVASPTVLNLGALRYTDGTARTGANAAYSILGNSLATGLSYTLTAAPGFFAALGTTGTIHLNDAPTCAGTALGTSTSATFASAAAAAAASSIAVTGVARPVTATNYYVCMTVNGSAQMIPGTPVLTSSLAHTVTTIDSNESLAATNLYPLDSIGQQIDVRSYIPAGAAGYTSFIRVINTGVLPAQVNAALLSETGVLSPAGILIASLPPGGSQTVSSTQVEAATGAIATGTARPRIRITAFTNGLQVQSFILTNANGNFSDVTGAQ